MAEEDLDFLDSRFCVEVIKTKSLVFGWSIDDVWVFAAEGPEEIEKPFNCEHYADWFRDVNVHIRHLPASEEITSGKQHPPVEGGLDPKAKPFVPTQLEANCQYFL